MSNMNGNPHVPDALMQLRQATTGSINAAHASAILAASQANATLALAYEQRTANLIALMAVSPIDMTDWPQPAITQVLSQNETIMARLGLNEGATK